MVTTESGNDRKRPPPSCRDKGRMWGRVGALCLSWWHDEWSGFPEANQPVSSPPGQAQGPLIHPTAPLVPTGCRTHLPRFGRHHSSGGWAASVPMGMITPFGWQHSLGLLARQSNYDTPSSGLVASKRPGCDAAVIFPDGHVIEM